MNDESVDSVNAVPEDRTESTVIIHDEGENCKRMEGECDQSETEKRVSE